MEYRLIETTILTLINAFGIFLIIVVLANSFKEKVYRSFVLMTITLLGWVDFAYLGYFENDLVIATVAYRINLAFVALFFLAAYIFYIEHFLEIKYRFLRTLLYIITAVFVLLSLFTDTLNAGVIQRDWGNEVQFGELNSVFSLYAVIMTILFAYHLITRYFVLENTEKRKIIYFLVGTFFLIIFNIVFNVLSPVLFNTAQYQHLGDYSAVIFLAFTSYAMLRYRFLDVKVALTASLISIIAVLLVIDIFVLSNSLIEQALKALILIFFITISNVLIRSVLNEIKQKEELQKAYKQVQSLRQHEQDMIDIMGHELRTPITIVRNSLGVMEMEFKKNGTIPEDKLKRYIDIAMESARREVRLVETLLSSAKADSRGFQLLFEKVDVKDAIQDSLELFTKEGQKKGLDVIFKETADYFAYADRVRTQEIVDNLLSNAVKYTDKGKVEVDLRSDDKYVFIEVADTGIGMSEEDKKKLGKKFYRVDQYIKKANEKPEETKDVIRPGGTGLGLYVAFSLINIMDGTYEVESTVGQGTKFTVKLPIYNGQPNKQEQRKVPEELKS